MSLAETNVRISVQPRSDPEDGAVAIVGDDPERIAAAHREIGVDRSNRKIEFDGGSSPSELTAESDVQPDSSLEDFERMLRRRDIDCVALAFERVDRNRFFGAVRTCREHGVTALVMQDQADSVLVTEEGDEWAEIEFHPWQRSQRIVKRVFDVTFAIVGLLLLAPTLVFISLAIKLTSSGPILYTQERTGYLGETFRVRKFRTMYPESENPMPENDRDNDRITPVGRVLRKVHMDEVPQLLAILTGDMSAVGPRATWTEEEDVVGGDIPGWEKRYFVKPGLTGLAQINNISSTMPRIKLRYDIKYVNQYSIGLDVRIVAQQIWMALMDFLDIVGQRFS